MNWHKTDTAGSLNVRKNSALSRHMKQDHKRAARMLGYVLTLNDEMSWLQLAAVLFVRLTRQERVALAYSVLMALDQDDAIAAAEAAIFNFVAENA